MNTHDFTPEENEFRDEIKAGLAAVRCRPDCPHPDLLAAYGAGVPLEIAPKIEAHLRNCAYCRQLSQDLAEYEHPGATAEQDRRIRSRWSSRPAWRMWAVAAAIVLLAGLTLLMLLTHHEAPPQSATVAPAVSETPAPAHPLLPLEKAPIQVPAAALLLYRGESDKNTAYLKRLAEALKPYRSGDYQKATQLLAPLTSQYPQSPEAPFYLAVSELFLGENQAAVDALTGAQPHAGENFADAVAWYRAVALNRVGRNDEALKEANGLCGRNGSYQERACAAVETLTPR